MKKILNITLVMTLLGTLFLSLPTQVKGKTFGDLQREVEALEKKLQNQENEQQQTEGQISNTKAKITSTRQKIQKAQDDVVKLNKEIKQLNEDIKQKDQEIKDILNFTQVSSGQSAYLEYAFGARDFTDFIYRAAVAEQLSSYNDKLIKQFNDMIESNKRKTVELKNKEKELNKLEKELNVELDKLGNRLSDIIDIKVDVKKDLQTQKKAVAMYKQMGCEADEELEACGNDMLPPETALWRPVNSSVISSDYGDRCYDLNGSNVCDFHTGVDVANNGSVSVFAAGSGVVAGTTYRSSCGGNIIYINHSINGTAYTTVYMHLRRMYVQEGDVVNRNTVIGLMGGSPSSEWWDSCSSGQHLHFMVSRGIYKGYNSVIAGLMNPRSMVNFPSYGSWFSDRTTRY